jgi:hypothetical protein
MRGTRHLGLARLMAVPAALNPGLALPAVWQQLPSRPGQGGSHAVVDHAAVTSPPDAPPQGDRTRARDASALMVWSRPSEEGLR